MAATVTLNAPSFACESATPRSTYQQDLERFHIVADGHVTRRRRASQDFRALPTLGSGGSSSGLWTFMLSEWAGDACI